MKPARTQTHWSAICNRVNLAANFFADTVDVDYIEGLKVATIVEEDNRNIEDLDTFPELKALGYGEFV
jgi:hypothetical protein